MDFGWRTVGNWYGVLEKSRRESDAHVGTAASAVQAATFCAAAAPLACHSYALSPTLSFLTQQLKRMGHSHSPQRLHRPRQKIPALHQPGPFHGRPAASISSAIASILVTLFQLRAVPVVFSNVATDDHGSLDLPAPLGK